MNLHPDLQTEKYKNAEIKTYTSITTLAHATGIDKKYFKLAKRQNFAGFCNNATVNWKVLKPFFEESYESFLDMGSDDIAHYKKEIAKREVKLKDLQIKKLEKGMLDPEDVKLMLIELATKQSVLIKKIFLELPPHISGKSEADCKIILDKCMQDIFAIYDTP